MVKKKLSRDQKRKHKKQQRKQAPPSLSSSMRQMGIDNYKVIRPPAGTAKMSEVLMEFIEPYMRHADNTDAMHKLIITALLAWNTALLPQAEQASSLKDFTKTLPAETIEDFETIVKEMIERKNKHFAQYTRHIINYNLTDNGGGNYYITVVSTLAVEDEE